jgi:hypothetical protein
VLDWVEAQQSFATPSQDRAGGQHFRINECLMRQQTVEEPAMPVSPLHHRRDTKAPPADFPTRM